MSKFRVIQWGVGYTGTSSLRYVVQNPNLELVGIKCHTESKEGKSPSEICGYGTDDRITATRDRERLLDVKADCVLFMPRDYFDDPSVPEGPSEAWMADLVAILESGANVVSPLTCGISTRQMANPQGFLERINAACQRGGATVTFTGFDPGFTTDYLAFVLASAVGEIEQIRTWEFLEYSTYPVAEILNAVGLGVSAERSTETAQNVTAIWSSGLHLLGESLGSAVDEVKLDIETYLAPEDFTTSAGMEVRAGQTAALWWKLRGFCAGRERFVINHVTRIAGDAAPDWPNIGTDGGYRLEIDSYPPVRVDWPMGLPNGGGSSFADAMIMTAARCVNSIEAVVNSSPGYKSFLELAPIGGKHGLAR